MTMTELQVSIKITVTFSFYVCIFNKPLVEYAYISVSFCVCKFKNFDLGNLSFQEFSKQPGDTLLKLNKNN